MPSIKDHDDFLNNFGNIMEAFRQAFIAETGLRPEFVDTETTPAKDGNPETVRLVRKLVL